MKEGKDPNESNPKPEPAPEETLPALDPNDPEVQQFGQQPQALQPFVEDVPDEQDQVDARLARQSSIDKSLHPSAQVSARGSPGPGAPTFDPYPRDGFPYTAVQDDNVSPLEPSPNTRNGSVGGGYFPEVPTFTSEEQDATLAPTVPDGVLDLGLPEQPSNAPGTHATADFESFPPPAISQSPSAQQAPSPQDFYAQAPPPVQSPTPQHPPAPQQPTHFPPSNPQPTYRAPPPQQQQPPPPQNYAPPPQQYAPPPQQYAAPSRAPEPPRNQQYNVDDESVKKAQKHAKFAISALNFEDGATAVKELRLALQTLGAL